MILIGILDMQTCQEQNSQANTGAMVTTENFPMK